MQAGSNASGAAAATVLPAEGSSSGCDAVCYDLPTCHSALPAGRVRRKEAANIAKMNLIRGTNMALQFAVLPIAAFITFSVVRRIVPHGHSPCQESDACARRPDA